MVPTGPAKSLQRSFGNSPPTGGSNCTRTVRVWMSVGGCTLSRLRLRSLDPPRRCPCHLRRRAAPPTSMRTRWSPSRVRSAAARLPFWLRTAVRRPRICACGGESKLDTRCRQLYQQAFFFFEKKKIHLYTRAFDQDQDQDQSSEDLEDSVSAYVTQSNFKGTVCPVKEVSNERMCGKTDMLRQCPWRRETPAKPEGPVAVDELAVGGWVGGQ